MFGFFRGFSPWLADDCLLAASPRGLVPAHSTLWCLFLWLNFSFGPQSDWIRNHPKDLNLITPLQTISKYDYILGFVGTSTYEFGEDTIQPISYGQIGEQERLDQKCRLVSTTDALEHKNRTFELLQTVDFMNAWYDILTPLNCSKLRVKPDNRIHLLIN